MNNILGIGVSSGFGIGKVFSVKENDLSFENKTNCDAQAEKQRFKDAFDKFTEETKAQADRVRESVGEKEAEILDGHILMLSDPFMVGEMENMISQGTCAEGAVSAVLDMFAQMFSMADDELTQQRATDVMDIKNGMLSILLGVETCDISKAPKGSVLVAEDLTPSMTSQIVKENIVGIVCAKGGRTSHSAILARAMEIPAVMSCDITKIDGEDLIVDGEGGEVIVSPTAYVVEKYQSLAETYKAEKKELEAFIGKKTATEDGVEKELFCNIGKAEDVDGVNAHDGEGVGLFRTEFLFMDRTAIPTEDEQFDAYKRVAIALGGKEAIIRTLDVGGDKDIPYLGLKKEENPFMGFRAVRYCLANEEMYRTQLRAILRASAFGKLKIMVPLVTTVDEIRKVKEIVAELKNELKEKGIAYDENIEVGIMTETAASVMIADLLAKESDFFSIGTNDLTGYTMSCDRGNSDVAYLYSHFEPSVLRSIKTIIEAGHKEGIKVGMCGEAAADPKLIPLLVSFGLDEFSVDPTSVLKVRKTISSYTKAECDDLANEVMALSTRDEILSKLNNL